jgi:ABC-2 type transport system permease protein
MTPLKILFLCVSILGAALIQSAGFLFTSIPSFWIIQNNSLRDILFHQLKGFVDYPISLYSKFIQVILTLVIPYAFLSFYPSQFFLGKNDFLMFHPIFQYLTPILGIILFFLAYKFWLFGINHYKSTGS